MASENIFDKLIQVIDFKIADHKNYLNDMDLKEESLQQKIKEGIHRLEDKKEDTALVIKELILSKDKVVFHKAAIATLEDINNILKGVKKKIKDKEGD